MARGANIMRGYWKNPDRRLRLHFEMAGFAPATSAIRIPMDISTSWTALKDMIVTGGENVYSGEVEAVIYAHPAVREAAVFGIPDPKWGELVMACVVLKPGIALTVDELVAHCRRESRDLQNPAPR